MTANQADPTGRSPRTVFGATGRQWRNRTIVALTAILLLVIAYFIVAAFIPRWWAHRVGSMSGNGSFTKGIASGFGIGFLCTLVPLLLLAFCLMVWQRRGGRFMAGAAVVLAIAAALPNLMTLSIVWGRSDAAHAGERILDVEAPGFRGASLAGAILALALLLIVAFTVIRHQITAKHEARAAAEQAQAANRTATDPGTPDPTIER
ncbi:permease [Nocardia stercoris]|uniref:Permease n=1 Tax=Nocardia stercoris TaxID=2483361 RepID=A0A3M2KWF3_9NOCA|nr:permease [Nocardia stercoris]RMI29819.1 permease [Nocardia stercoris]